MLKKHPQIVTLLSNGPIQNPTAGSGKTVEKQESTIKKFATPNSQLNSENAELQQVIFELQNENSQLKTENSQLKSFLRAVKEKPTELDSANFQTYEEGPILGFGAQSNVREISKVEKYAKKELAQFDHKSLQRFLQESETLVRLRHPCIVRIHGFDYGDSSHPPSIFLSLEKNSLEKSIQKHQLTNEEKNRITIEIVLGMRYIHRNNNMHRDLKPANILLSQNKHVRISDFGLAKEEDFQASQSKGIGTLRFMAPELFPNEEENEKERYTNKVDVYAFGIVLIYIVTDEYPKYNMAKVLTGELPQLPSTVCPWVVELIHQCLQLSANDRPTFNDIFEILKSHDFDLFAESNPSEPTIQQRKSKEKIERRILKIEAFEYQHQL